MSPLRSIPPCGTGRITLALLAVVPAVMAYPWRSPRDYWVLGIAATVVIVLLGWWHGLHFTTILRRRLAIVRRTGGFVPESDSAAKTTALLRLGPPVDDSDVLPLPLIARYLDRYGIRADKIRITSRDNASDASRRETWIGLTVSAADNLAALQARSSRIPLHETARGGRSPAGRPPPGDRMGSQQRCTRRRPAVAGAQRPRNLAGSAAGCLGLRCGIPSPRRRRVARNPGRDPVASRRARPARRWRSPVTEPTTPSRPLVRF